MGTQNGAVSFFSILVWAHHEMVCAQNAVGCCLGNDLVEALVLVLDVLLQVLDLLLLLSDPRLRVP